MIVNKEKKYNFVVMDIELSDFRTVNMFMKEFIKEGILVFGEHMDKIVSTPAKRNLLIVKE